MRIVSLFAAVVVLTVLGVPRAAPAQTGPLTVVDFVLDHEVELALLPAQVQALERLDTDLARELIRRQADLAIAHVDLGALMDGDPTRIVDVARTEASVRDIERGRAEVQLALVRATEAVKAQLTPEQRTQLAALLKAAPGAAADGADPPAVPAAVPASAPSGRGHSGGHPPHPGPGHHPSHDGHSHAHVWIGTPLWWDPFWVYPPEPVIVEPPPAYVQQSPAYWYYCPSLRAYYPHVASCPETWVPVPAQ